MKTLEINKKITCDAKFERLKKFEKLMLYYNAKFNLTSIIEEREILYKHFFDSLICEELIDKDVLIAEIGSGAGFPSVPLKIFREDLKFTLIESTKKKCDFLKVVKDELKFENFNILNSRCEDVAKTNLRESFDYAVARAVCGLNTLCEYAMPLLKKGGILLAYKGTNEQAEQEIKASQNALKVLNGKIEQVYDYDLEEFGKRCIIKIIKTDKTPEKYPRGHGKERTSPL